MICPNPCEKNKECGHRVIHKQNSYCFDYATPCKVICVDAFLHKVKETIRKAENEK